MSLDIVFTQFLNEKRFINNASPNTILFYEQSFKTFNLQDPLTKSQLNERVASLRQQGKSPSCCNAYIRGINSFLSWLFENGHLIEKLRVKSLKAQARVMKTFTDTQIRAIGRANGVTTLAFMFSAFLLWGVAGYRVARSTASVGSGLQEGSWSALVCMVIVVTFGFAPMYWSVPSPEDVATWSEFKSSGWTDARAFAIANTLDSGFSHLLIGPIVGAVFGGLAGIIGHKLKNRHLPIA